MGFLKDCAYFFVNYIVAYIPSRKLRMIFYFILSKGRISKAARIGMGVKILDIRNIVIGKNSNINFGCILDGRGASVTIMECVDIAPQVNIWTMQHKVGSAFHESESFSVRIESGAWLANRVVILPGSRIGAEAVVGAGVSFKGILDQGRVVVNSSCVTLNRLRKLDSDFVLGSIRRFR